MRRNNIVIAVIVILAVIVVFFLFGRGNDQAPGQPSPHALDQSQSNGS